MAKSDSDSYMVDVKCDECGHAVSDVFVTCGVEIRVGEKLGDGLYERRECRHDTADNTITAVRPY